MRSSSESTEPTEARSNAEPPVKRRLGVSVVAGVAVATLVAACWDWRYAPAVGWDTTALAFCGSVWLTTRRMSAPETAANATSIVPRRPARELLILSAGAFG